VKPNVTAEVPPRIVVVRVGAVPARVVRSEGAETVKFVMPPVAIAVAVLVTVTEEAASAPMRPAGVAVTVPAADAVLVAVYVAVATPSNSEEAPLPLVVIAPIEDAPVPVFANETVSFIVGCVTLVAESLSVVEIVTVPLGSTVAADVVAVTDATAPRVVNEKEIVSIPPAVLLYLMVPA
jgi:hypothetical protein